jgi:DNA-binding transcriptional LysR family regulator
MAIFYFLSGKYKEWMKIRDLSVWESFYWVAKEGSFTRASKRQRLGLPHLSKRIAKLEDDLGVRLFQRSTRKVSLTHEGRGLFPVVQSFLEDAQSLEERFETKEEISGTIRMSCVTAFAHRKIAPLITKFNELHPKVRFELEITDSLIDLIDNQIDLAIRVQEPAGSEFVFKKLIPNELVVCASPEYLKKAKKIRTPEDLLSHRILTLQVYEDCRFGRSTLSVGDLMKARAIHCENGLFLTELARQGGGVAIRSIWDVESLLRSKQLIQVLERFPLESYGNIYAVIPNRRLLAQRVRAFITFLESEMKNWSQNLIGSGS